MTGDRTFGLTTDHLAQQMADLGDDNSAERLDLGRAFAGWVDAASAHLPGPHPVEHTISLIRQSGTRPVGFSNAVSDRLVHLLNIDAAVLAAHRASTGGSRVRGSAIRDRDARSADQ